MKIKKFIGNFLSASALFFAYPNNAHSQSYFVNSTNSTNTEMKEMQVMLKEYCPMCILASPAGFIFLNAMQNIQEESCPICLRIIEKRESMPEPSNESETRLATERRENGKYLEQKFINDESLESIFHDNFNKKYLEEELGFDYTGDADADEVAKDFLKVIKRSARDWIRGSEPYRRLNPTAGKRVRVDFDTQKDEEIYNNGKEKIYDIKFGISGRPSVSFRLWEFPRIRIRYDEFKVELRKELLHGFYFKAGGGADYDSLNEIKAFARVQKRIGNGLFGLGLKIRKRKDEDFDLFSGRNVDSSDIGKREFYAGAFYYLRF